MQCRNTSPLFEIARMLVRFDRMDRQDHLGRVDRED